MVDGLFSEPPSRLNAALAAFNLQFCHNRRLAHVDCRVRLEDERNQHSRFNHFFLSDLLEPGHTFKVIFP